MNGLFDDLLEPLGDKQRDALVAAWAALEYGNEPASEAALLALRDAALRRILDQILSRTGRILVNAGAYRWTSGYRDDIAAELAANGWGILPPVERAALTLVLIHSVAIPRAEGLLAVDDWQSPYPTTPTRMRKLSQVHGQRRCPKPSSGCALLGWSARYAAPIPRWPAPPTFPARRCSGSPRPRVSACRRT